MTAKLVDENLFGRSEMCLQFASLLAKALRACGIEDAAALTGMAKYRTPDGDWFEWQHAWVEYSNIVVDANVDSMPENPLVPEGVNPPAYWGARDALPPDRDLDFASAKRFAIDADTRGWWDRLQQWLRDEGLQSREFSNQRIPCEDCRKGDSKAAPAAAEIRVAETQIRPCEGTEGDTPLRSSTRNL